MLQRSQFYNIKTNNKNFKAIFLGSYYKISSSNNNKTAYKSCDFLTKDGLFISENFENIIEYEKITEEISDNLNELIKKYEEKYWKQLENMFLISKITKELASLSTELNNLSNEMKIENNYFTLKDLVKDNWLNVIDISPKFKSLNEEISLNCTISKYIYHDEIDNISLSCFEMDVDNLNSTIVKDISYKIKDVKTAYKLYDLTISKDLIENLNANLSFFKIDYNKNYNNLKITDKFVCIDNVLNIKFDKFTYSYEEYIELKDDLNYCLEEISNYLTSQLIELKLLLKEVIYGVEQEIEYEKQLFNLDILDIFNFNFNITDINFSNCYS